MAGKGAGSNGYVEADDAPSLHWLIGYDALSDGIALWEGNAQAALAEAHERGAEHERGKEHGCGLRARQPPEGHCANKKHGNPCPTPACTVSQAHGTGYGDACGKAQA